jgi:hypothetical protein
MLNRKATNYIFYGILVGIVGVVFLVRFFALGSINGKIDEVHSENVQLQSQIETLEILVAENRDVQTEDIYLLYDLVPNVYTSEALTYKVVSMLEVLGISESDDYQRTIYINDNPSFPGGSELEQINSQYKVVQVEVYFTSNLGGTINQFLDDLYNDEQLFIVRNLNFDVGLGGEYTGVSINFLAIYDVQEGS